jgi:pimeloyl-ACP methyl ester carboxylesterase
MRMRKSDAEAQKEFSQSGVTLKTETSDIQGFPLHYAQTGSDTAQTLLFVHGSPGSWSAFENYLKNKTLQARYRIISIDRPGFGYSDFGNAKNLSEQAIIIAKFMDKIDNNRPVIIVGHSLGGPLVVKLSALRPQLIKKTVILAGALDPSAEAPEKWRSWLFKMPLNWFVPGALRPSNQELWFLKQDLKEMIGDFGKIHTPVYIFHGKKDMLVPYSNVAYAQKMLTNASEVRVTTFENENHFIVWTQEAAITQFLLSL